MGNEISDSDRADVERLAILNSHKATMLVGAPWKKLLRRHGFSNEHEYLALMSQVVRRFAAEPALAEAFAQRNQAETAARIRETAVAKGLDPDAPGFQWHEAFQIDDKKARAFHRTNEKLAAEPGPAERAAFDAWKRSCAEAAPVDPEPLVASGRCSRARTRRGSRKNCVWRRLSPPPAGTTKDRRAKSRAKTGS